MTYRSESFRRALPYQTHGLLGLQRRRSTARNSIAASKVRATICRLADWVMQGRGRWKGGGGEEMAKTSTD